jgi:hypothetical protein
MQSGCDTAKAVSRSTYFTHKKLHDAADTAHVTHTGPSTQSTRDRPLGCTFTLAPANAVYTEDHPVPQDDQNLDDDGNMMGTEEDMDTGDDDDTIRPPDDSMDESGATKEMRSREVGGHGFDNHFEDVSVCIRVYYRYNGLNSVL